jgi:outer membrane biosynthesis protein TonB
MESKSEQSTDNPVEESTSVVEEGANTVEAVVDKPKKATPKKKAVVKRKKATAKSKRPKQAAEPVEPIPTVYTLEELKAQGSQAKQELVSAVIEPALEAAGSLSQTIRDTIGGALAGLLSRRRR